MSTQKLLQEKRAKLSPDELALLQKRLRGEVDSTGPDIAPRTSLPMIVPAPEDRYEPFPLTDIQQAYWIGRTGAVELGNVATHSYHEIIGDGMDLARLEFAWQRLIEHHDLLRAIVRPDGQQQILEQVPPYHIQALDLRGQPPDAVTAQINTVRQELSHQVLPSDQWPLFEIRASLLDDERLLLHISVDYLLLDTWSVKFITSQLLRLYQDPQMPLVPLELSFRDYVLAEKALRDTDLYQESLDYWLERLPTLPPAPDLPLAKSPDSLVRPRFVRRRARLAPETWRRLKGRASQAGLSSSGMLLAAFAEVLTVWSKTPHFTINLTLFNRLPMHFQVNDIVGDFTSLTLVEVDNTALGAGFELRARRIQEQLWRDLDHRYVSGVHVMRELARMQGGSPRVIMPIVFTSALTLGSEQEAPHPVEQDVVLEEADDQFDDLYNITQTPQVWIDHQVDEDNGALVFNWDAVEDLFPAGLLDDMFEAYRLVLHRLAEGGDAWQGTMHQLVQVPAAQLEQRIAVNATEAPVSGELLHTLFIAQVGKRPSQPAVVATDCTLTYELLYQRSNQVGHWLRERGVRPNELVAVVMEKGWEQVAAVLGVLNAGAAYLPIGADLPQERIEYLLKHGEVGLVLTQPWVEERLAWPEGIERLCVTDEALKGMSSDPLEVMQGSDDLAYVIFTSGSTGQPKGVMIDHRGAVNTILDVNERLGVTAEDRVLALSALNFDLSVYDVFGLLAAGGTIVMPDAEGWRDPAHWLELMVREGVTLWDTVPALMEMLAEYVDGRTERLPDSLRLVFLSGDWIPVTLPERIRALGEGIEVWSGGGATEASIWSIVYPIDKVDPEWTSIPYGKPMVNQTFHVLDEALAPRPVWVPGELYIGGIGLAKGYWRDEEKTAASFVTHPHTGERLYRTGDWGRYLPDGNIEFLGREDFQVKVQGHRIELGEIEVTLLQHPEVRAGVVTAVDDPRGTKRLVAYVIPDQDAVSPAVDRLRIQGAEQGPKDAVLLDPIERLKFKLAHPGIRRDNGGELDVQFTPPELSEKLVEAYVARRSYRKFASHPVTVEQLGKFLSCLLQIELADVPLPKYRYGSAGGLYPVQVYLYIKPEAVESVAGGTYYYHPEKHRLVRLAADARIEQSLYGVGNRDIFDLSAFAIFLIGQLDGIRPMYGEWAEDFCKIEAGAMTQLLETWAPVHQIGLCQIGGFDFDAIRHWFALSEGHVYLHGLLGGQLDSAQIGLQGLVEDSSETRVLLELLEGQIDKEDGAGEHSVLSITPHAESPKRDDAFVRGLRGFVQDKLPGYMVPAAFVLLEELPLTPNGKVDRQALPEPDEVKCEQERAFVAPRTPTEETLASICTEILRIERIGVYDNLFELGGNSVMAVQIVSGVRKAFQVELPLRVLFETPTVADLSRLTDDLLQVESPQDAMVTLELFKQKRQRQRL